MTALRIILEDKDGVVTQYENDTFCMLIANNIGYDLFLNFYSFIFVVIVFFVICVGMFVCSFVSLLFACLSFYF